jgi:FG-GAP-like repeat
MRRSILTATDALIIALFAWKIISSSGISNPRMGRRITRFNGEFSAMLPCPKITTATGATTLLFGDRPLIRVSYILQSQTGTVRIAEFGLIGDDPSVVADYDGDGHADPAVYRNAAPGGQSYFYYLGSLNNPAGNITYVPWGIAGDIPAPGDFDGDGRNDFVVQRNENGTSVFYLFQSINGFSVLQFGLPTDLLAFGDYDGDRKTDFCVVRPENQNLRWWIRRSGDGSIVNQPFGLSISDSVTQGDYNGDGITDISVWRPNPDPTQCFFYERSSASGQVSRSEWGIGTDYPAANFNVH